MEAGEPQARAGPSRVQFSRFSSRHSRDVSTSEMSRDSDETELEQLSPASGANASTTCDMIQDDMELQPLPKIMGIPHFKVKLMPIYNDDYTALHLAVLNGNMKELNDLLEAGNIDLNYKTKRHGYTALMLAIDIISHSDFRIEPERIKILEWMIAILLEAGCKAKTLDNSGVTPIYYAAERGLITVVKTIIGYVKDPAENDALFEPIKGRTLLHVIVRNKLSYYEYSVSSRGYDSGRVMCLDLFLNHSKINVNDPDYIGNTVLHYAAKNNDDETVLKLLRHGACVSLRNGNDELPLANINSKTLHTYLDECITTNDFYKFRPSDKDYEISINYGFLVYIKYSLENKTRKVGPFIKIINDPILMPETDALLHMVDNEELRPLLKHPVITSFMYLKWQRISCLAYANITFYSLLWICLVPYIIWGIGVEKKQSDSIEALNSVTYVGVIIGLILLIIRELCQLILSPVRYVKGLVNWMEIALIFISAWIVFHDYTQVSIKQQLSAVAILISSAELLVLIGLIPELSTNILMLKTVSLTFFKFLLWYCVLIIAFALSFYTLFRQVKEDETAPPPNLNNTENEKKEEFFNDPFRALFKTIVMLTGEFDAGSIQFNMFPVLSHIIFIMFVFMITIVLSNLLNGLAVSDTQKIRDDAELVGLISRIKLISYFESVLIVKAYKNPTKCWAWVTTHLQDMNICINKLRTICIRPLVKRICLFPHFLRHYKIIVTPNQDNKIWTPSDLDIVIPSRRRLKDGNGCFGRYRNYKLDRMIVQNTKVVISKKENVTDFDEIKGTLLKYEPKIDSIEYIKDSFFKNESKFESLDEIKPILLKIDTNIESFNEIKATLLKYESKFEIFNEIKAILLRNETKIEKLDEKIEKIETKIEGLDTTLNKVLQTLERMTSKQL